MAQATAATMRKEWGRALRSAREAQGLTQAEVATKVGLNQANVSRIEAGDIGGFDSYLALAQALDVNLFEVAS